MASFIKLTDGKSGSHPVWINMDHVHEIVAQDGLGSDCTRSVLVMNGYTKPIFETPDQIMRKLDDLSVIAALVAQNALKDQPHS